MALGEIGDPRAVEPLIATLQSEKSDVRQAAVRALGKLGDLHAVEPLIGALGDQATSSWGRYYVQEVAAEALGRLGDHRATEPLIIALKGEDSHMRRTAAEALGKLGDSCAVKPLIAALKDQTEDWEGRYHVREAAAAALERIGTAEALAVLRQPQYEEDIQ